MMDGCWKVESCEMRFGAQGVLENGEGLAAKQPGVAARC
jgi:hypothetical protein